MLQKLPSENLMSYLENCQNNNQILPIGQ